MIFATLCDVSDPWQSLITRFLNDFEVTDLESRDRKVWNFIFDCDGSLGVVGGGVFGREGGQPDTSTKHDLFPTGEHLDGPDHYVLFWHITRRSSSGLKSGRISIFWSGDTDFDGIGNGASLVLGSNFDEIVDATARMPFDHTVDKKERLDFCVETIGHEFKIAIRRDETDDAVGLEPIESNALMKLDIIEFDGTDFGRATQILEEDFIVETEFEFGHSSEETAHFHTSEDFGADGLTSGTDDHIEIFNHIEEDLVFAI